MVEHLIGFEGPMNLPPNTACTRLGVRAAFLGMFLALGFFHFDGESMLPPQAGNASR
jgi:hypothetical protein